MRRAITAAAVLALLAGCAAPEAPAPRVAAAPRAAIRVPLMESGGTPVVEVAIAGVCCFFFTVDSGAADVSVSPDLFFAMVDSGLVTDADDLGIQKYRTAGGHTIEGLRFRMPPMTIGRHTVYGVVGSVTPGADMLLLGNSFLRRFRGWSIDNATGELVLVAAKVRL